MAALNFDASQVAPDEGQVGPVPGGWYNLAMDESSLEPTKAGDGSYLKVRFNILDGQYVNRKIYVNLNIRNKNEVSQRIGMAQLSAIAHAVGVLQVADSSQLHNRPLKAKVKIRQRDGYEPTNEISAYRNINEQVETVQASPLAPPMPPAAPMPVQPPAFVAPAPVSQPPAFQQPVAFQAPVAPAFQAPVAPVVAQQPIAAPTFQQPAPVYVAPVEQPEQVPSVLGQGVPEQPWAQQPAPAPVYEQPAPAPAPAPAPVAEQPAAPFDPLQPPAWMTTPPQQ